VEKEKLVELINELKQSHKTIEVEKSSISDKLNKRQQ
jgi:hypothetical protein